MRRYNNLAPLAIPTYMMVFGLTLILLLTSCRTSRSTSTTATETQQRDSIIYRERVRFDTLRVPYQAAAMSFPFQLLKDSMLNYMEKSNGRAKVIIQRVGDTIYAQAQCDSLEKIVAGKDTELAAWHKFAREHVQQSTTVIVQIPLWFRLLVIAAIALAILSFIKSFIQKRP
jgi:hypothetical protein